MAGAHGGRIRCRGRIINADEHAQIPVRLQLQNRFGRLEVELQNLEPGVDFVIIADEMPQNPDPAPAPQLFRQA